MFKSTFHYDGKPCIQCGSTVRYIKNRKCVRCIDSRRHRYDTPEYKRAYNRKSLYGISSEDTKSLLGDQGGRCPICGKMLNILEGRKLFQIDHDHKTNKIRGILCSQCNTGLARFNDDPQTLHKAILYLEKAHNVA